MSEERDPSPDRDGTEYSPVHDDHGYLVKLLGIPLLSTADEIKEFLQPCRVVNVHLFSNTGSSSGECLVDLESETDVEDALKQSGRSLDKKYVEVFKATNHEYNFYTKHKGTVSWREPVLRMSGLPFACTMADVQNFFESIEIARNGIYITRDMSDKALGDGFVAFVNMENAFKAIDMHDQKHMQHRYIELFPSTYEEAKRVIMNDARSNAKQFVGEKDEQEQVTKKSSNEVVTNASSRSRSRHRSRSNGRNDRQRDVKRRHSPSVSPPPRSRAPPRRSNQRSSDSYRRRSRSRSPARRSPPSSGRSGEFLVKMRGMPYTVVEDQIRKFFPSSCPPARIEILQDRRMHRSNGDAHIYFNSLEDANEAMKCDRKYMGTRYIELYFDPPRDSQSDHRRKKPSGSARRSSRSPSRSRKRRGTRSRSDSDR